MIGQSVLVVSCAQVPQQVGSCSTRCHVVHKCSVTKHVCRFFAVPLQQGVAVNIKSRPVDVPLLYASRCTQVRF